MAHEFEHPVTYTVVVQHWQDGDIDVQIKDVGYSESDRLSVAYALRLAADLVEKGRPIPNTLFS